MIPDKTALMNELRQMVVDVCEKDVAPASIGDDEPMFGPDTRLQLDSLDALQLSMALQKRFGLRITDSKETRRAFSSPAYLADFLLQRL